MNQKILIFALESINNIGEELLRQSTEYLVRQISSDAEITIAQLKPNRNLVGRLYFVDYILGAILMRVALRFKGTLSYRIKKVAYKIEYDRYYSHLISKTDKIIMPIGMLKYGTQDFSYLFYLINKIATKYNKGVMMSAMSPQEANKDDWRYHQLVKAVNFPSVKMVTTRDGESGVNIIKRDYLHRDISCDYVGDPALWIPEAFKVKKEKTVSAVPWVGINIIRKGIFKDYNNTSTDEHLKHVYTQLITLLEKRHWRWSVFCNGMASDWQVLCELQSEIGFTDDHISSNYNDSRSYAEMVSRFDVVFGARLHSCITSVAVGTPVVGFIWEDKLKYFCETMGIDHFFFNPSDMTADKVLSAMEKAMKFDYLNREYYKLKTKESIKTFLKL